MRITKRVLGTLGIGVASIAAGVTLVWAAATDNMVPTGASNGPICYAGDSSGSGRCQTDNAAMSIWRQGTLETVDRNMVANVLSNEYSPTDLAISYPSSAQYTGSSETDVIYQEDTVSGTAVGRNWCDDTVSSWRCDQQYVRIEGGGDYTYGRTCHETGHAVGLLHGADANPRLSNSNSALGCLVTPTSGGEKLGSNNREHINQVY
ncbi:hypothetical protein [Streptomyces indicus]|uniref:Matrixin n=1 Tax=Streptomyces indicus TaxID=417292 RepID=A0A1G8UDR1_9ACTN|nr:hypothetical protein [Streptomyces indicus]SDJ51862.1 hypothetical protein SAMN05421806_101790 [Streptomyces indicus]